MKNKSVTKRNSSGEHSYPIDKCKHPICKRSREWMLSDREFASVKDQHYAVVAALGVK